MEQVSVEGFSLSPQQRQAWETYRSSGRMPTVEALVRVEGQLPMEDLQTALVRMVEDFEILRTRFELLPGTNVPVQVIADTASLRCETLEWKREEFETSLAELRKRWSGSTFDPNVVDALRIARIRSGGDDFLFVVQTALHGDLSSVRILLEELAERLGESDPGAQNGLLPADEPDLDEEAESEEEGPLQYADVAQWLHDVFDSEEATDGLDHWRNLAAKGRNSLRLPWELRDDGESSTELREVAIEDPRFISAVTSMAERFGLDTPALLVAAWQSLLWRLGATEDFLLGVTAEGRDYDGVDACLGPIEKVLPIESSVATTESFLALARHAQEQLSEADAWHEFFDSDRLSGSRIELPIGISFIPRVPDVEGKGVTFRFDRRWHEDRAFQLHLQWEEGAHESRVRIIYDAERFDAEGIASLADQLMALVAAGARSPETPVAALELLSEEARSTIIDDLAWGPDSRADGQPVQRLFERHARENPDAVALAAGDEELTYGQLNERANRLARHLVDLGVGSNAFVGIQMGRSVETVEAILAVLKCGGAYLPLPPDYPAERLSFMAQNSGCNVVLALSSDGYELEGFSGTRVLVDQVDLSKHDARDLDTEACAESYAYIIYTSGSTGMPKGVPITHANLACSTQARIDHYGEPVKAYLLASSFAFDSSVAGIFWTLASGGRLVLPADGFEKDLPSLVDLVERHSISHLLGLPSLWAVLLDTAREGQLSSLRTVIVAGESCGVELVQKHITKLPATALHNEYGPTEGTVWSTTFDCRKLDHRTQVPIGRPVAGVQTYILDEAGTPTAFGVPGELCIGGSSLTPGYHNRPDLTEERFFANPYGEGNLYRTGDRARMRPDGEIDFLGRLDHQVKVRGYRIELEEIEAVLKRHASLADAVVASLPDARGDQRLVAYVTPHAHAPADEELRRVLEAALPHYMIPQAFVTLSSFPLLPNGKVDRSKLPEPDMRAVASAYVAPVTTVQRVIANIWCETLEVERVGLGDDFFQLGGHSILATQLVARIVDLLKVKLAVRTLFENPTLEGLCDSMLADSEERARLERTAELLLEVLELSDDDADDALEQAS